MTSMVSHNGSQRVSPEIITVAGCKGGVGKSVVACAIALEAGRLGRDVILVDADLGGANLHTYLGMHSPRCVISDFLSRRVKSLSDIVLDTEYPGVRFVSSAGNVPSQANPRFAQKTKIIKGLQSLKAELVIVDIGAGSSYDVMDFFSLTNNGVLVTVPEPTSIVNSYGFVKNVLYRRFQIAFRQYSLVAELLKRGMNPDDNGGISAMQELLGELTNVSPECWFRAKNMLSQFAPNIIVNMTTSEKDARVGEKLKTIIEKYLSVKAKCLGDVVEDPAVRTASRKMVPFMIHSPGCPAAACVRNLAPRLIELLSRESEPARAAR